MLATIVLASATLAAVPAAAADTIPAVAVASGRLDTLVAAVTAAGLAEAISGEGPFTVFAPTDAAFAQLPEGTIASLLEPKNRDTLVRILKHHVVPGRLAAADLVGRDSVETLAGTALELDTLRGRLLVADAVVETADVRASNGVVHLIDRVLMPPAQVAPLMTLLENAVDRGAPIFNDGNPAACAAIYATALEAAVLVEGYGIEAAARKRIATRLVEIHAMNDGREQAWAYRRIIDSLVAAVQQGQITMAPASPAPTALAASAAKPSAGRAIFTFDDAGEVPPLVHRARRRDGRALDRTHRGGQRHARLQRRHVAENNGGFSSMRVDLADGLFDGFDAVKLRVKGDGREYRLGAKAGRGAGAGGYWAPFATTKDRWIEVVVPIADLERHFMGQRLPGRLDPADLKSLEFYIYDKKAGPFRLELDSIEAVRMKDAAFDA